MTQLLIFLLLIGIFIYGMTLLRSGLFNLSANSLKNWLAVLTNAPWKGLLIGTLITAILQSSSAVMIITIGMVSARMLTFPQTIGIILGTNIGTTFTTELITFNIESYIIPIAVTGSILAVTKRKNLQSAGLALLGISAVFAAMRGFEYLAGSLKNNDMVNQMLLALDGSHLYAVFAGIIITAIIQSSTATTGIIMGFLTAGTMDLNTAIAIMLGSNIGTCVDAYLASIGSGREAKLSAYAHIWLNCIGVAAFYPFIDLLAALGQNAAAHADVQLAHISVLFNVLSSLLVLPFANQFGRFIIKLHDR
ncbi:Na/Pi cotransporter family protein [Bacillus sp. ISL-47]|uniref:Na/Pi symporter n=1 Tax=Bacillus sp. ISL-47 TaxID=2819130 RepID=UPI001BE8D8B9|nr:Na/Pi symporter [Bacillus sp. ISL-47]MBT2690472.1 Na/Pi cotransporter family protein [Bacillus sp. ISL-47]MBT2710127.1 Na/Pi cotransporter family protein [Pseudomonas sp. ISL-84]